MGLAETQTAQTIGRLRDEKEKLRAALILVTETVGTVPLLTAVAIKNALEQTK